LYRVLDGFSEVLDRDLEPHERQELLQRLKRIAAETHEEDLAQLAQSLANYLESNAIKLVPERITFSQKVAKRINAIEKRLFNRSRLRLALIIALAVIGSFAVRDIFNGIFVHGQFMGLEGILTANIAGGEVRSTSGALWFLVHLAIQIMSGLLALISAGFVAFKREKRGIELATISLVLFLTMGALLSFFVDQFSAVTFALIQFIVFLTLIYYRRRYMKLDDAL
jgi:hypothetical protein